MKVEYASFPERRLRAEYIARRFGQRMKGKLLDVGCDRAILRDLLPKLDYFGIDVGGTPDLEVDLEKVGRLPFADGSFDWVICTDVLEHLSDPYGILAELARVTRKNLILSLPNNWTNARRPVARGKGAIGHYGLPVSPPKDRHKWFFSLTEAETFIEYQAQLLNVRVEELFAMEKPRLSFLRWGRRLMNPSQRQYLNRYAHTLWAVLEKK